MAGAGRGAGVVLPDLDKDLTAALADLEELLLTLRWQETGDPDHPVVHPAALGGGVALQALRRVADTLRPTQTDPEVTTGGRLLGPDGRYEHVPLRFIRMRAGHRVLNREFPDPDAALVARVAGVLDLEWTPDTQLLRARLDQPVAAAGGDVVLTAAEETAYQRVITRFNWMWTPADPVDRWNY